MWIWSMYGIINKAIEEHVVTTYGGDKWERVRCQAGLDIEVFVSNEAYPDEVSYKLVDAATDVLGISASEFLIGLGEHWVLKTGIDHYGPLLRSAGDNLKEFLLHLPQFHARVMLFYPKLQPPEFSCTDVGETSLRLHYFSHRPGLTDFVVGLVQGLGKLFKTPAKAALVQSKAAGADHDIFEVTWAPTKAQESHGG
jgi:hypothetical protein